VDEDKHLHRYDFSITVFSYPCTGPAGGERRNEKKEQNVINVNKFENDSTGMEKVKCVLFAFYSGEFVSFHVYICK